MKTVTKKIDKEWFELVLSGKKKFELRLADFDIKEGDILRLEEWTTTTPRKFTGRLIEKKVNNVQLVNIKDWINQQPEILEKGFYTIQFDRCHSSQFLVFLILKPGL